MGATLAAGTTSKTISEQWGTDSQPKNCFEVLPAFGLAQSGTRVSDWNQLVNIDKMSFEHRISGFKRCFPWRDNKLTSLALFLETPYDQTIYDPDEIKVASKHYELDAIGFEYGDCKEEKIDGDVLWFEIQYTQVNGV